MRNPLIIRKSSLDNLFVIRGFSLEKMMRIEVRDIARYLFYLGMFFAIYGSLNPWFIWPIYQYYQMFAFVVITAALLLARGLKNPLFNRKDYIYPTVTCTMVLLMMAICSGKNINGIFMVFFSAVIYLSLFKLDMKELQRLGDFFTKLMAALMCVSIPFYLLHLVGFPLPHSHVAPEGLEYSYENYWFFLVDDRFAFDLLPRFTSVFLEPSHLGMACITLLYAQIGKWNTWRCRILFFTIFITFSLAAYLCLVVLFFSATWVKGKSIVGKLVLLFSMCAMLVVGALTYNRGDNIVNNLIVQRLSPDSEKSEVGEDNTRTSGVFDKEYKKLIESGDWVTGKGMEAYQRFGFGNAGYKVFVYCYGAISVIFLVIFLITYLHTSPNPRAAISAAVITFVSFIPHGIPLKYYFFVPIYISAFIVSRELKAES